MATNEMAVQKTVPAITVMRERIAARRSEIEDALTGTGITFGQMQRAITTAAQINPDLVEKVSFQSMWLALMRACRDGLLPDGVQGAIVPYKNSATWIPMYRGLISRFERSGQYKWIGAGFHRADDKQWRVWIDENGQHFIHEPGPGNGAIIETYACATTTNGAFFIATMNEEHIAAVRKMSRASREDAPWNMWPDEMRKKSALRQLTKLLPTPEPINELMESDKPDYEASAQQPEVIEVTAPAAAEPRQKPQPQSSLDHFADGWDPPGDAAPVGAESQETEPGAPEPTNEKEYLDYAKAAIDSKSPNILRGWFASDDQFALRKRCNVSAPTAGKVKAWIEAAIGASRPEQGV